MMYGWYRYICTYIYWTHVYEYNKVFWMDEWMGRWMYGSMDGWVDGWMDG